MWGIRSSRRLLPFFLATTLLPPACLAWLAWRVVQDDRQSQILRIREQREQAADLAASSLQRVVAEAEARLASFSAGERLAPVSTTAEARLTFDSNGITAQAGDYLLFYPALPKSASPASAQFAAIDELEFRKKDFPAALRALDTLVASGNSRTKAAALLRQARIQRNLGNTAAALEAFSRLGRFDDVAVEGLPAGLVAHQGRALIFESAGDRDNLQREAAVLCDALESGQWVLTRAVFEFSDEQARQWLATPRAPLDPQRVALAEAAEALWRELPSTAGIRRRVIRVGDISVLALTQPGAAGYSVLLMPPRSLESAWLRGLNTAGRDLSVHFALTDADGQAVLGHADSPLSLQAVRPREATHLPWSVLAISASATSATGLLGPTRLFLTGIVMMALLALIAGLFVNRAILRELRVARLQSDFVAAVSHEFRTPLTAVRQLAEMLASGRVSNDERRQQFYQTLLSESERLWRLVDGLLNFGRMEAGQLHYRFESIDPAELVRGIVQDFGTEAMRQGYRVELHGDDGLPAIRADRESLSRVFWNLLDNAMKYSPASSTIWVDLSDLGKRLAVRVRDRGMGIPEAEQKEIFGKFVRGAASKQASIQGTGVGLAIARQIVVAHGGEISVESRPGEGSVFTVLLPVVEI